MGSLSLADSDDLELVWSPRSDDFTLADSYTLAGDLTFERTNPDSILNCLAQGRENARQTRHLITTEMWLRLNLAYLRIRNLEIEDIWAALPEDFYAGIIAETDAFAARRPRPCTGTRGGGSFSWGVSWSARSSCRPCSWSRWP